MDEIIVASICVDCALWHANGDTSGMDADTEARVMDASGVEDGYHVVVLDFGTEFTRRACDACHSPLGGARYDASFVRMR